MSQFWQRYLNRSLKVLQESSSRMWHMAGANEPSRAPRTLFRFNSHEDLQNFATGCDADIGGTSTVHLDLDETSVVPTPDGKSTVQRPTGKFWGNMSLEVRRGYEGRIRAGYAGFRNKPRTSLFGTIMDDVTFHRYLALRVRVGGAPGLRNSYYVNIQTDGPIQSDLWQHRLFFRRNDGGWEDVFIDFNDFVLTNAGQVVTGSVEMNRERVRTVGVSLLGGNTHQAGPYELGIDSISIINDEDIPAFSLKLPPSLQEPPKEGLEKEGLEVRELSEKEAAEHTIPQPKQ
ncbi:CIA30-domain-containing protein [Obba rivulosa]|uniref:CIA30-domain-containing protein n=1 Tax=Obba rivulosa TaxID=1052685 RepID=A0A8E2DJJ5_9APHY|nr:CIA30-domain-containing protein [Obba rivulosa]